MSVHLDAAPAGLDQKTSHCTDNPAMSLQLRGLHLIEASAGTGKTWTLSALIVRLILEGDYVPRQIIATTFTRAAAAELRARIRQRLEQVRRVIKSLLAAQSGVLKSTDTTQQQVAQHALATVQTEVQADLFLAYVIHRIESGQFGLTDRALAKNGWTHCLNRLDLALQGFDELFVGTLDSFCQKLLSEFSFESGQGEYLQISEQEHELCAEILHDTVRQWRAKQDPRLIALMLQTKRLHDGSAYQYSVAMVMNFLSAQLAPVGMPILDFSALEQLKNDLMQIDIAVFDDFSQPNGAARDGLNKKKQLYKLGGVLPSLIERLQQFGVLFLLSIAKDSPEAKLLDSFKLAELEKQFNKGHDHFRAQLLQMSATTVLSALADIKQHLTEQLDQVEQHLTFVLSQTVRDRLPIVLTERGETSFSQQMRVLANALDDPDSGAMLAQHIRHRYPIALVDEFQDTNADQDRVIARIYRTPVLDPALCLILVGDPKQAIYGFRGGDVQTYLQVRSEIQQAQQHGNGRLHGLTVNQRSVLPLVQAVNALFLRNPNLGDGIVYPAISAGERLHAGLSDRGVINPSPLRLIELAESKQESQQIAWQIMQLLAQSAQGELLLDGQPLQPEHIAVLGFANYELDQVQNLLLAAKIDVWRPSRCSVFEGTLAKDLAALLHLLLTPYHEQRLRRALSGQLVGWDLARLDQLDTDATRLIHQQMAFADEGQIWEQQGFLAAWQRIAERLGIWTHLAGQPEAERQLVNLRHLLEILHEQSERIDGTHHLLSWFMRQISQPKTREWEMERRLPSQSGVQLMTIHASKGLEFPVVLVQGLDKRRKKKTDVVFYLKTPVGQRAPQRMLGFNDQTVDHLDQHHKRIEAEYKRLAYVALTRASHRLYLPLLSHEQAPKINEYAATLSYWLAEDRLDWVADQAERVLLEPLLTGAPDRPIPNTGEIIPEQRSVALVARPLPKRRLSSWGMTSFSAMTHDREPKQLAALIDQPDYDADADDVPDVLLDHLLLTQSTAPTRPPASDEDAATVYDLVAADKASVTEDEVSVTEDEVSVSVDHPEVDWSGFDQWTADDVSIDPAKLALELSDAIIPALPDLEHTAPLGAPMPDDSVRFSFQGGITGGNCLHKILEYLDPSSPADWPNTFKRQLQAHLIKPVASEAMSAWFTHIVQAQLPAGACLANIGFRERVREMEFYLSLPSGEIDASRLLARLAQAGFHLPKLRHTHAVRYLNGSIDLVYQHAGKFYIADYKSNFLGKELTAYHPTQLRSAMDRQGYWLQAALYLVALHRYLMARLPNYQIAQHLGGANYLFLRGMYAGDAEHGILAWRPDDQLIEDLDAILAGRKHPVRSMLNV